ncbi:SRPBCC family protein [Occultella glacieicola]|uniref:SRPBCC family protein n=1 Tax=Occultella glacieicola TaxID=2518684 RepID=A0ABY2DYT5_9MICO|nr:SRPBCC family protein [Occultella glacieicola]TDE89646.1 SRPBCC family protein [Occultella glacieicola]
MSDARATGYLRENTSGLELVFERTLEAPVAEIWSALTTSEGTASWIGTWTGDAREGGTVSFTMTAEDSAEPEDVTILECQAPSRLQVEFSSEAGVWHLEADLQEVDGVTRLEFSQLLDQGQDITGIGPGWDFYLDRLVASRTGAAMPSWDDYHPALAEHYAGLG